MEFKVFGHAGIVLLAFPSQDGRFYDYENRNLIQSISYQIDQGKVKKRILPEATIQT